jgi:hypothetical protein
MNNKQQEDGAGTGPLIFTVPAYGFVMALYLDWLNDANVAAVSAKTYSWNCLATQPRTANISRALNG